MSLEIVAGAIGLVGAATGAWALFELRSSLQLLRRRSDRVRHLRPGPVEFAGIIRARGEHGPLIATSGVPSVARVLVDEEIDRQGRAFRVLARQVDVVPAVVEETGASCDVELDGAHLLAEEWELREDTTVSTEWVVPDGAFVVVSGVARLEDGGAGDGYRDAGGRLVVHGTTERPLVVSVGGQARALLRHDARGLAALAAALILGLVAALTFGLERLLTAAVR